MAGSATRRRLATVYRLFSTPQYEWLVDLTGGLTRVDPLTGRSMSFITTGRSLPADGEVVEGMLSPAPTVWVLDRDGGTVGQKDASSGQTTAPVGVEGTPEQAVVAFGAVWVAAGHLVDRVDTATRTHTVITMPRGVWAGSIAADAQTSSIWVGNSVAPRLAPGQ